MGIHSFSFLVWHYLFGQSFCDHLSMMLLWITLFHAGTKKFSQFLNVVWCLVWTVITAFVFVLEPLCCLGWLSHFQYKYLVNIGQITTVLLFLTSYIQNHVHWCICACCRPLSSCVMFFQHLWTWPLSLLLVDIGALFSKFITSSICFSSQLSYESTLPICTCSVSCFLVFTSESIHWYCGLSICANHGRSICVFNNPRRIFCKQFSTSIWFFGAFHS